MSLFRKRAVTTGRWNWEWWKRTIFLKLHKNRKKKDIKTQHPTLPLRPLLCRHSISPQAFFSGFFYPLLYYDSVFRNSEPKMKETNWNQKKGREKKNTLTIKALHGKASSRPQSTIWLLTWTIDEDREVNCGASVIRKMLSVLEFIIFLGIHRTERSN